MPQVYPTELPTCVLKGSLSRVPTDFVVTSNLPGYPITRNRYTGELYDISWQIRMSSSELDILLNWYHNTLRRVLSFWFVDPLSNEVGEYFFVTPPQFFHVGGTYCIVTFNLETA